MQVNIYLNFNGTCEEAFAFYQSVFGGEFSNLSRFADMPSDEPISDADQNRILHVALPLGDSQVLMGSDRLDSMGPTTAGDNVHISLNPDTPDGAARLFASLADGGQITMLFDRTFWGADFGMCTDRFGIHWMVNYDRNETN